LELNETKKIKNIISKVYDDSIANELGIEVGDILLDINENPVEDIIEYKFLISEEYLEVKIQKQNGEIYIYEIEKEIDEELGIEFQNPIIDKAKSCRNKCIFCFIDQLPKNMRKTLYFKDDDSRLSFLQGNFITLTNMSDNDIDKIIKYRISPINVSIHTTNEELRIKMLNNKNANKAYSIMKRLSEANIQMNCQIVLCKNINDKDELKKSLYDLKQLESVNTVAVVPIGITKYREGLFPVDIYDEKSSLEVIELVEAMQEKFLEEINTRFVFLSDEFYVMANKEVPNESYYEGYKQLENGIGLIRRQLDEYLKYLKYYPIEYKKQRVVSIATGKSAYKFMMYLKEVTNKYIKNLKINVYQIDNNFFGKTITVSGLITGIDLIEQLKGKELGDSLLITKSMLKSDEDIFLDDYTLEEVSKALDVNIIPVLNEGKDLLSKILLKRGC
jgi:putative radical SAM enzyme (TIGR03279 family)